MKTVRVCLFFVLICFSLQAEMRYWRNVDGTRFEGEFSQELFDVYYIRTKGGADIKLPVDKLDPVDAEFLKAWAPPRIEIDFRKKGDRKVRYSGNNVVPPSDSIEIVTGTVTIKKLSKLPYSGTLTVEAFLIGKELLKGRIGFENSDDIYRVFAKKTDQFTFGEERNSQFVLTLTGEAPKFVRDDQLDSQMMGFEFFGYVVLVTDAKKNVIAFDSGRLKALKVENMPDLRKVPLNSFCNERGQRVPVPRPRDAQDMGGFWARF